MRCLRIPVLNRALLGTFALLLLLQFPFGGAGRGGMEATAFGFASCKVQRAWHRGTPVLGDFPGVAAEHLGAGGARWPSLQSPNHQLSTETACDRRVKEERYIKAALILQGKDMSADSYLGTLRYQNP